MRKPAMIYLQRSSAQFPATVCPPDGSEENNSDRNPRMIAGAVTERHRSVTAPAIMRGFCICMKAADLNCGSLCWRREYVIEYCKKYRAFRYGIDQCQSFGDDGRGNGDYQSQRRGTGFQYAGARKERRRGRWSITGRDTIRFRDWWN